MSSLQRLKIFKSGAKGPGKVITIPESYEKLVAITSEYFKCTIEVISLVDGSIVSSIDLLRDNDTIYVSDQPFLEEKNVPQVEIKSPVCAAAVSKRNWITLNVGGKCFATTRSTLMKYPESMLSNMFSNEDNWENTVDRDGNFLIDRSPQYFEPLLNYLRNGVLIMNKGVNPKGVLEEAKFFGLKQVIEELDTTVKMNEKEESCVTRSEFMRLLMTTSSQDQQRCQGVNLSGADLSYLDLRSINFKHADLSNANLTGASMDKCQFFLTDLSNAVLDDATLDGVQMKRANLEGASLRNCKFETQSSSHTTVTSNLEGANLKGAILEGSQMSHVNLRLAILKNANMQNCVLRDAVLAGADMENCNLTGADLQGANLRGANVVGTIFLDIVAPLHMVHLM